MMMHPYIFAGLREKKHYLSVVFPLNIIESISERLGLTAKDVTSRCRKRPLVLARIICSKLLYKNNTLKEIGAKLGGLDHSSVIYLKKSFDRLIETNDKEFLDVYSKVEDLF